MAGVSADTLYKSLVKTIIFAAVMVAVLWLLSKTAGVFLLLLFIIVLTIVINAPVAALEQRGLTRGWACAIVFISIFLVIGVLGWLVVPIISKQLTLFITNLPDYVTNLSQNIASWFKNYPAVYKDVQEQGLTLSEWLPSLPSTLMKIGNYSLSIASFLLIMIFTLSTIIYAVVNPRPLVLTYFSFFSAADQAKATEALKQASAMLIGWIRANLIGGSIRAVCVTIFLSIMHVPAAMVWGLLTFFSELIPRFGFYMMAIPTLLVSLSVSPYTALWVFLFIIALDEIMADLVLPRLRYNTMNLHPVSTFFVLLVMATAFGTLGVLLATPLTAIIKAYYEVFFMKQRASAAHMEEQVDAVLYREKRAKS